MTAMAAALKFFKRHLFPNRVGLSQNLMGGMIVTQRFRTAKIVPFWYRRGPPRHHSDTEIQNSLNHCVTSEDCISTCISNRSVLISKRAATAAILKFLKQHLPNRKSDWAKTERETSQWHRNSELLKSFRSDIQDGRHGSHIGILQTTSLPKP